MTIFSAKCAKQKLSAGNRCIPKQDINCEQSTSRGGQLLVTFNHYDNNPFSSVADLNRDLFVHIPQKEKKNLLPSQMVFAFHTKKKAHKMISNVLIAAKR